MKAKTSITLSEDLLKAIDERAGYKNRSEFIETALRSLIAQEIRDERNVRDVQIINERAESLNEEAADVLEYQFTQICSH